MLCPLDKWGPGCIYMRGGLESRLRELDKGLGNASLPVLAKKKSGLINEASVGKTPGASKLQRASPS